MYQPRQNSIDYIEMPSTDLDATRRFFSALWGWKFQDYGPDYIAFDDDRIAGGFFSAENTWPSAAACPLVVFYTSELEMTRAIFDFPGGRRFHFRAPGTGEFAVWSDK